MKSNYLLIVFYLFSVQISSAQLKKIKIETATIISRHFSSAEIYLFPDFQYGTVYFKNLSKKGSSLINYNQLLDEMQFIIPNGDTLSLSNEETISYIAINKDTFFYNNGYFKQLASTGQVKLLQKQIWMVFNQSHQKGYKTTSDINQSSYSAFVKHIEDFELNADGELELMKETIYFIADKTNAFQPLNRKNLVNAFPSYRSGIEQYMNENKPDLLAREDVIRLFDFIKEQQR